MEITKWNRDDILNQFESCKNVGELLTSIESFFSKKGELVCEIAINGSIINESEESKLKSNNIEYIKEITIKSNTQEKLTAESLESLREILTALEEEYIVASEFFRMMEFKGKGQEKFDGAIKKTQLALDLSSYMIQASKSATAATEWQSLRGTFLALCQQTHDAFQNKNYVLVSDLLEYEFTSFLQNWKSWLTVTKI